MARKKTKFLLISAERDRSIHETKMHSSRIRTAHSLPYGGGGGSSVHGGSLGAFLSGEGSLSRRGLCPGGGLPDRDPSEGIQDQAARQEVIS